MPVYYLEPSALVKYYVTEPGSTWVRQVVDAEANVLVSAEITIAEVGSETTEELLAGQHIWSSGVARVCPPRDAVYFVLGWR